MSQSGAQTTFRDPLEKARTITATVIFVAGLLAIAGSLMDWVSIDPPPRVPIDQADNAQAYNGIEAEDGVLVAGAGVAMIACAALVVLRAQRRYAWLAFLFSIIVGAIAIVDYRAVSDPFSAIALRMERIGSIDAGPGLLVVATGGVLGVIGAVLTLAALPREAKGVTST